MKKAFFLLAALLLIATPAPGARAAEMIPYYVKGINIDIPEAYDVLTRETEIDDETMRFMEEKDIYLDAGKEEGDQGIRITIRDMEIDTLLQLDDGEIEKWSPYFEEQSKEAGDTVEESTIYHHDQTMFHKMHLHFTNSYGVQYVIQYNTIILGKWISIEVYSGLGPISPEQEAESEKIIDSIRFLPRYLMDPVGHTDAFQYLDPQTGAAFTVPENWSQEPLLDQSKYPHAIFYLNSDPDATILYGSTDLWSRLPQEKRTGQMRKSMESPMFGPDGVAGELGISPDEVFPKRYGDTEYAVGRRIDEISNGDGESEDIRHLTLAASFNNGYAYYFCFPGWEDHENYKDLEAMLSSMKYPGASDGGAGSPEAVKWIGLSITAFLAVLSATIILYGRGRARRQSAGRPKNCRFCGARLPGKGEFCPACGTRIEE